MKSRPSLRLNTTATIWLSDGAGSFRPANMQIGAQDRIGVRRSDPYARVIISARTIYNNEQESTGPSE